MQRPNLVYPRHQAVLLCLAPSTPTDVKACDQFAGFFCFCAMVPFTDLFHSDSIGRTFGVSGRFLRQGALCNVPPAAFLALGGSFCARDNQDTPDIGGMTEKTPCRDRDGSRIRHGV